MSADPADRPPPDLSAGLRVPPDHAARRARALHAGRALGAEAVLVTGLVGVRYLTGFTGSNGVLLLGPDRAVLVTDGRYRDQAAQQAPGVAVELDRVPAAGALRVFAREHAGGTVAVEAQHLSVAAHDQLRREFPEVQLLATTGLVEALRRDKDPHELALLAAACTLVSGCLDELVARITPGMTERRIARDLTTLMQDGGAEGPAFDTIVATGHHSAIPHHEPTMAEVRPGDLLKIDAGALVDGYRSDITRTYVVGAEPTARQREVHQAVATAAAAARKTVAPGVPGTVPDVAARAELERAGLANRYTHGLGHGVGLEIHEAPMLGRQSTATIGRGDVLTIEPGAYLPGFGGVRIEDTLAVTSDGIICLTTAARELIRLA